MSRPETYSKGMLEQRWRRTVWAVPAAVVVCMLSTVCGHPAVGQTLPHLVVYLSDDHSQYDSSLYGDPTFPMPHLTALAQEGMTFSHCFVASPSCAPSRAALLTGLMPARNGAQANHTQPRPEIRSLVEGLRANGYQVAAFGKVAHGKSAKRYGFEVAKGAKSVDKLRTDVGEFLSHRQDRRPLCLFVGTSNPHVPWPEVTDDGQVQVSLPPHFVKTPGTRLLRLAYRQEIVELDQLLGDLRTMVRDHLGPNTVFVHSSDHGGQWPFGKWTLYDYGIRVPLVISWPDQIPAGKTTSAMVSWVDLLPTLFELVGGQVPHGIDGRSFERVLRGGAQEHRKMVFATHTGDGDKNIFPIRCVRTPQWKLIHNLHPEFAFTNHTTLLQRPWAGRYWKEWTDRAKEDAEAARLVDRFYQRPEWELYDVADDPWEQHNRAGDPAVAEVEQQLREQLQLWRASQPDPDLVHGPPRLLSDRPTWHPDLIVPAGR